MRRFPSRRFPAQAGCAAACALCAIAISTSRRRSRAARRSRDARSLRYRAARTPLGIRPAAPRAPRSRVEPIQHAEDRAGGRARRAWLLVQRLDQLLEPRALTSQEVEALVGRQPEQPRAERGLALVEGQLAMRRQKNLLQQVVSLVPADHPAGQAEQPRRMRAVQLFEGARDVRPAPVSPGPGRRAHPRVDSQAWTRACGQGLLRAGTGHPALRRAARARRGTAALGAALAGACTEWRWGPTPAPRAPSAPALRGVAEGPPVLFELHDPLATDDQPFGSEERGFELGPAAVAADAAAGGDDSMVGQSRGGRRRA